jgi:hypothetical protein
MHLLMLDMAWASISDGMDYRTGAYLKSKILSDVPSIRGAVGLLALNPRVRDPASTTGRPRSTKWAASPLIGDADAAASRG